VRRDSEREQELLKVAQSCGMSHEENCQISNIFPLLN
jgi:hypothetical protein